MIAVVTVTIHEKEAAKQKEYKQLLKKYEKLYCSMKELEDEDGGTDRKEFKKFVSKQKECLKKLGKHRQWKKDQNKEQRRLDKKAARQKAEREADRAEEEQRRAAEAIRKAQEADLKASKAEALAKLRASQAARKEQEKLDQMMREKAEEEARNRMRLNMSHLEIETEKRRREYEDSLYEQEDRGLIRIERRK